MYRAWRAGQLAGVQIPGGDIRVATVPLLQRYGLTVAAS